MANWGRISSRGNVEDRRGIGPLAVGGMSAGAIALMLIFNLLSGGDLGDVLGSLQSIPIPSQQNIDTSQFEGEDEYEVFASTVLGSNNDMWQSVFSELDQTYSPPKLVLFRTATESACGTASSEVGPHYCPLDSTIYLDETFFDELTTRLGAKGGDVAQAYVISHEVAHHVQNQLGIMDEIQMSLQEDATLRNDLSVKLELQADCFAGLWANSIRDAEIILPGEIGEAMDAAAAVGDDRIQKRTTGYINPESWTHGSSEQRVNWFNLGYEEGNFAACNTFEQ